MVDEDEVREIKKRRRDVTIGDVISGVDTEEREAAAIEAMLAQLPEAVDVRIYRRERTGDAFLGRMPVASFSEEAVQQLYGGGEYQLRVVDSRGTYVRRVRIYIAGKPKDPDAEPEKPHAGNSMLPVLLQRMDTMEQRMFDQRMAAPAVAAAPVSHGTDIVAVLAAITPLVVPILKALIERPPAPGGSAETLAVAADLFTRGVEVGGAYANGKPPSVFAEAVPLMEKITGVAGTYMELKSRELGMKDGGAFLPSAPAAPAPAAPAPAGVPAPATPAPAGAPHWADPLVPYVPFVLRLASSGKDPTLYADLFLDQLDAEQQQQLTEVAQRGKLAEELYARFPVLRQGGEWMDRFAGAVVEALTEEPIPLPQRYTAAAPDAEAKDV